MRDFRIPTQERIDTSRDSRDKLEKAGKRSQYRKQIYAYIQEKGGATCDEIEVALRLRHQTASCFIRFMTQEGWLRATDQRKQTRAGRKAIVWALNDKKEQQMEMFA